MSEENNNEPTVEQLKAQIGFLSEALTELFRFVDTYEHLHMLERSGLSNAVLKQAYASYLAIKVRELLEAK